MSSINWVRVVLGGLVAGLIINVSGILLAHFVLGPQYIEDFKSRMPPQSNLHVFVKHVGLRFWFGLLAVFLYAGFRPRFGPGPRTAIIAAATVSLSVGLVMLLTLNDLGLLAGRRLWIAGFWTLAETMIATLIGARLYHEAA